MTAHPAVPRALDLAFVRSQLANEMFHHPHHTLVAGVRKLPPAHVLIVDRDGLRLERYWDPDAIEVRRLGRAFDKEAGEYAEELRSLLDLAVPARLPDSNAIAGAHTSGGLDSSSLAVTGARLAQLRGSKLIGYSWAPPWELEPPLEGDERDLVEATARLGQFDVRYTALRPADLVSFFCRDPALQPRSMLDFELATSRQAVDDGVDTMISGWGGDELVAFNGRGYFADLARRGHLATVQRELRLRAGLHGGSLRGAWKSRVVLPLLPQLPRLRQPDAVPLPAELRPDFAAALARVEPLRNDPSRERPGVRRMQLALLDFGHLQQRTEAWAAHGASIGLTYSFPLLDKRVMEFALSLPGAMFFHDGWKRWLYRVAMEHRLPDVVRWNRDKYDTAASLQLRRALIDIGPLYKERLLGQRDNPFVDVDALIADYDGQVARRGGNADADPAGIATSAWLPFTQLRPW